MNIQHRGVLYVARTERELLETLVRIADLEEQRAQKEAIARNWLRWSPIDEPLPGQRRVQR